MKKICCACLLLFLLFCFFTACKGKAETNSASAEQTSTTESIVMKNQALFERDLLLDSNNAEMAAVAFSSIGVDVITSAKHSKSAFSYYAAEITDENGNEYFSRISKGGTLVFIRNERAEYIYMDAIMKKNQAILVKKLPIDDFAANIIAGLLSSVEISELKEISCETNEQLRYHVATMKDSNGRQYVLSLDSEGSIGYLLDEQGKYLYFSDYPV
jgi:hypothetical protein